MVRAVGTLILDFSTIGSGDSKQIDLCDACKYTVKIQRHNYPAVVDWLTGAQIMEQYGSRDVKITVRGIKRCARHAARGGHNKAAKPAFLEAALNSGIDLNESVDKYRSDILKSRHTNVRS